MINYRVGAEGEKQKLGQGYITELSESAPAGDLVTFTGVLTGFGAYTTFDPQENNVFNYDLNFDLS